MSKWTPNISSSSDISYVIGSVITLPASVGEVTGEWPDLVVGPSSFSHYS